MATVLAAATLLGNLEPDARLRASAIVRSMDIREGPSRDPAPTPGPDPGANGNRSSGELGLEPVLSISNDAPLRFTLTYAPTVHIAYESDETIVAPGATVPVVRRTNLFHDASLRLQRDIDRWSLRSEGRAARGEMAPLYETFVRAMQPTDSGERQPTTTTRPLPYESYGASAGASWAMTSTMTVSLDGRLGVGGGIGEEAVGVLPRYREFRADARGDIEANPRSVYGALLTVTDTRVVELSETTVVRGGGSWTYLLGRPTTLRLSGGIAVSTERGTNSQASEEERAPVEAVAPWAEGSIGYDAGERTPFLLVTVGGEPAVDRFRGTLDYRLSIGVRATWRFMEDWRLGLSGAFASLEPWLGDQEETVDRTLLGTAEARIDRTLGRYFSVGGVLAGARQESGRPDLPSFQSVSASLEFTAAWDH